MGFPFGKHLGLNSDAESASGNGTIIALLKRLRTLLGGVISIGHSTVTKSVTPAITAGAYTANDALGGKLEFTNAVRSSGGSATIESVVIIDDADQQAPLDLVLFDRDFTPTTDNDEFDPSEGDLENCLGHIPIQAGEYATFKDNCVATKRAVGLRVTLNGTSLFGQMAIRDAKTYAATDDITVKVVLRQD